jgi:hypothetical protein
MKSAGFIFGDDNDGHLKIQVREFARGFEGLGSRGREGGREDTIVECGVKIVA